MKLQTAIEDYIRHKQNLGCDFEDTARLLRRFGQALADIDAEQITPQATKAFVFGDGRLTQTVHSKYRTLRGLFRFMVARKYISSSRLPVDVPKKPEEFMPHIYTRPELRGIFRTAKTHSHRKIEPTTFYTLIVTLYACGLRLSEALRLTLRDVDLNDHIFTVRDTKFYKTRCVPFSSDLKTVLLAYLRFRSQGRHPAPPEAFLLVTRESKPITIDMADNMFRRLCATVDIRRTHPHPRYGPRLHDLRHTFAVHRLTACYKKGGNPQALLPQLSTYLGHVDIGATKRYLTMTPELLRFASERFEQYAVTGGSK